MQEPTVGKVMAVLEELAPVAWAESWDNVGLLVGNPERPAGSILIALELTDGVVEEAIRHHAKLILVHHPPIFKPLKALRFDTPAGRRLERLIQAGIGLYAAHTNLDQAHGGTNDTLAATVGLTQHQVLYKTAAETLFKLAVFVPKGHEDQVRTALARAGAGHIGNYSHCTFLTAGTGTFLPLAGTHPYIGKQGELEHTAEFKLESILPQSRLEGAVAAMVAAHPYEEPAYDLYPLANPGLERGHGRIGDLSHPETLGHLAERLKQSVRAGGCRLVGDLERSLKRVAVGAGSGGMLIPHAILRGADVLITGDIDYHEAQDAVDAGLCLIDIGHFGSEQIVIKPLATYLRQRLSQMGLAAEIIEAQAERDPFLFA